VDVLTQKAVHAAREFASKEILVAGGVSANQELRSALQKSAPCPVRTPPLELCTDNAAMVAAAGHFRFQSGQHSPLDMDVIPDWELVEG
jgi:N6-L-threonylcarbamoyladenine synthase